MTPEEAVFYFQVVMWLILVLWVPIIGCLILRVGWWKIKLGVKKVKETMIEFSLLSPFLIPLALVILIEALGG